MPEFYPISFFNIIQIVLFISVIYYKVSRPGFHFPDMRAKMQPVVYHPTEKGMIRCPQVKKWRPAAAAIMSSSLRASSV